MPPRRPRPSCSGKTSATAARRVPGSFRGRWGGWTHARDDRDLDHRRPCRLLPATPRAVAGGARRSHRPYRGLAQPGGEQQDRPGPVAGDPPTRWMSASATGEPPPRSSPRRRTAQPGSAATPMRCGRRSGPTNVAIHRMTTAMESQGSRGRCSGAPQEVSRDRPGILRGPEAGLHPRMTPRQENSVRNFYSP